MNFSMLSRNVHGLTARSFPVRASRCAAWGSVRFSSKKSDSENSIEDSSDHTKKPFSSSFTKRGSSTTTPLKLAGKAHRKKSPDAPAKQDFDSKYIPISHLPKPPKEMLDMPQDLLYSKIYMRDPPEKPEIDPPNKYIHKFKVPLRFIHYAYKDLAPFEQPKEDSYDPNLFEPASNTLEIKMDQNMNPLIRITDHPLKESITGLFAANHYMHYLDNEYLWSMYPSGKLFGNAPYGGDASFDGFKKWEDGETRKIQEKNASFEARVREVEEFTDALNESNSFYRKPTQELKKAGDSSAKAGGRRKLDRGLLRKYRKYKKEGLIRKNSKGDGNDHNDDF